MAGRLYRMAKVVSANPKSWGIVDANEISGFKRVAKLSDLYSIAECILSSSYGDGVTNGADAVGQIWHVSETNHDYKLINWANRKSAAGWDQVADLEEIYNGIVNEFTPVVEDVQELKTKEGTLENSINSLKSKVDENKSQIDSNYQNIYWVIGHFGQPEGFATLDAHGHIPLDQLGNLDMTVFTVVESLPTSNIENKVYLVRSSLTSDKNNYIEYIYTGDRKGTYDATKWEKLGEVAAKTDLSGYYKKTEVYNKTEIDDKVNTINNSINNSTINTFTAVPYVAARPGEEHEDQYKLNISLHNGTNKTAYIKPATNNESGVMTSAQKIKLDGIAVGANNYTHPSYTSTPTKALYKINVDGFGHVSGYTEVTKEDITKLGIPGSAPTVDAELSDTSTNAVQNKVLKQAIGDIESVALQAADDISVIQDDISAIQNDYYNSKNLVALTDTELNNILV